MANCTLSGNSANQGGGIYNGGETLVLQNTIVAGNSAIHLGPDVNASVQNSSSYNLVGNGAGLAGIVFVMCFVRVSGYAVRASAPACG